MAVRARDVGAAVEADKQTRLESCLWSCRNFISYSAEILPIRHVILHVSCGEA